MKQISLTQGKVALVSDEDFDYLNQFKWTASFVHKTWYAQRGVYHAGKKTTQYMHRLVCEGGIIDHRDGDGLNNQRGNLRGCTHAENLRNRGKTKSNTSGHKGVYWNNPKQKWQARIQVDGKHYHLGYFDNITSAAEAYAQGAAKYHQEFART